MEREYTVELTLRRKATLYFQPDYVHRQQFCQCGKCDIPITEQQVVVGADAWVYKTQDFDTRNQNIPCPSILPTKTKTHVARCISPVS